MEKNKATTIGGAILAGLLLRPALAPSPSPTPTVAVQSSADQLKNPPATEGEGPWVASCKYWAPVRLAQQVGSEQKPESSGTFNVNNDTVDIHIKAAAKADSCPFSASVWGLPPLTDPPITGLVAIVPDPAHSSLKLEFDRTIDSLIQAATDNGYLATQFWLPWKASAPGTSAGDAEPNGDLSKPTKQEEEPGLIIFKHICPEPSSDHTDFYAPLYLFLVGETPSLGVDGIQLQRALRYEKEALGNDATYSLRPIPNEFGIIGPSFSGSAASLVAGIQAFRESFLIASAPPPRSAARADKIHRRQHGVDGEQRSRTAPIEPTFHIAGATSAPLAANELNRKSDSTTGDPVTGAASDPKGEQPIRYLSFDHNGDSDLCIFKASLLSSGYTLDRFAFLIEDATTLGNDAQDKNVKDIVRSCTGKSEADDSISKPTDEEKDAPLVIGFPRDISMLRNAYETDLQGARNSPSPYLHLSLKEHTGGDAVPRFSHTHTPLSQEAQLMSIARQLREHHAHYIGIVGSSALDQIFLARFLHRACPDARLVFFGGDLLFEREIDNLPFIGSLTVSPYPLSWFGRPSRAGQKNRAYSDEQSQAYYNAASYTLWAGVSADEDGPTLADYGNFLHFERTKLYPPLYVTAIGHDGYYPLAIASLYATNIEGILPIISGKISPPFRLDIYPSRAWVVLSILTTLLCILHFICIYVARYDSPITCDLDLVNNDEPRRRAMYIQIATAMLFCMATVVSIPLFGTFSLTYVHLWNIALSVICLLSALLAFATSLYKTHDYLGWVCCPCGAKHANGIAADEEDVGRAHIYWFFSVVAWLTMPIVTIIWTYLCFENHPAVSNSPSHTGLFFSYRCVNPGSGVSPVLPVFLLLGAWYIWACYQTRRLRFSRYSRPRLPGGLGLDLENLFFVSDQSLDCHPGACLYENMTCLFITRQVIRRFLKKGQRHLDYGLTLGYLLLFGWIVWLNPIKSLDHLLWRNYHFGTLYEFLFTALFFPLMVVSLAGYLRMIFVWGSLRRGLLEWLDYQPMRDAFTRLKNVSWTTMLSLGGKHEQWRDMARCTQAMRQILNYQNLTGKFADEFSLQKLEAAKDLLDSRIRAFGLREKPPSYELMEGIERSYALFSEALLSGLLIPYWRTKRTGPVQSEAIAALPLKAKRQEAAPDGVEHPMDLHAAPAAEVPAWVAIAEEFLALRYVALIRAVLVNMRYLVMFIAFAFVLSITALNLYPFEPREAINLCFTFLLVFLAVGIVWVFAQMHHNPILSRITDTSPNTLGSDFWVRIFSVGAVPVLSWLAYQFPDITSSIFNVFQPASTVVK